jgi:hypothetical protein
MVLSGTATVASAMAVIELKADSVSRSGRASTAGSWVEPYVSLHFMGADQYARK